MSNVKALQRLAQRAFANSKPPTQIPSLSRISFRTAVSIRTLQRPLVQARAFSQCRKCFEAPITSPQDPNAVARSPAPESPQAPSYELTFTCKPCTHRSTHRISKQGYHHGTVLITCPQCKNRHIITDHLRVFNDKAKSFEEILMEKAAPGTELRSMLKKGTLGFKGMTVNGQQVPKASEEEAVEFWQEGREASEPRHRAEYKKGEVW